MKLVRMTAREGDVLLAEGDPEVSEEHERLVEEFRRQLDAGMWAAVPLPGSAGRHEAAIVRDFAQVPRDAERVIFFPPAAGGAPAGGGAPAAGGRARRVDAIEAERRGRELLGAVAGPQAARMYEELGFLCSEGVVGEGGYAYLIYPQRPLLAYDTASGEPLSEFCVKFRDLKAAGAAASSRWGPRRRAAGRLCDADDVLAKWLALRADERGLLQRANIDRLGRQLDPGQVRRDIAALAAWRAGRAAIAEAAPITGGGANGAAAGAPAA